MLLPLASDAPHAVDETVSESNRQQAASSHAACKGCSRNAHQVLCWTVACMASIHGNPLCWVQAGSPHLHNEHQVCRGAPAQHLLPDGHPHKLLCIGVKEGELWLSASQHACSALDEQLQYWTGPWVAPADPAVCAARPGEQAGLLAAKADLHWAYSQHEGGSNRALHWQLPGLLQVLTHPCTSAGGPGRAAVLTGHLLCTQQAE